MANSSIHSSPRKIGPGGIPEPTSSKRRATRTLDDLFLEPARRDRVKQSGIRSYAPHGGRKTSDRLERVRKSVKGMGIFGATRHTTEWKSGIEHLKHTFAERAIPGLYAVIMPAGSGKSHVTKFMNVIDVDECVSDEVHNKLAKMRTVILRLQGKEAEAGWIEHNKLWYAEVRKTLLRVEFSEHPAVILVHTEEAAFSIGAMPIGALVLEQELHDTVLAKRAKREGSDYAMQLGRLNRDVVMNRTLTVNVIECADMRERNVYLALMVSQYIEIPFPLAEMLQHEKDNCMGTMEFKGFSRDVPDFIMAGEVPYGYSVDDVLCLVEELRAENAIPEICMWGWQRLVGGVSDVEASAHAVIQQWIELARELRTDEAEPTDAEIEEMLAMINKPEDVDWFEVYPHQDAEARRRSNVSVRSVLREIDLGEQRQWARMMCMLKGCNHNRVTCTLLYLVGVVPTLKPDLVPTVFNSGLFTAGDAQLLKWGGTAHTLVRNTGTFFNVRLSMKERSCLMYPHHLYGRMSGTYSVEKEVEVRTRVLKPKRAFDGAKWTEAEFSRLLNEGIREWYNGVVERKKPVDIQETFEQFFKLRHSWGAAGATSKHHAGNRMLQDVLRTVESELYGKVVETKKTFFEREGIYEHIVDVIDKHWGYNITGSVTKNEVAKLRGLLPGNIYHYVVFSYILHFVERAVQMGNTLSGEERALDVIDALLCRGLEMFMYDYKAFNEYHEVSDMKECMRVMSLVLSGPGSEDLNKMMRWAMDSFENMEMVMPTGEMVALRHGLYSGWRCTAWINNALNHAYKYVTTVCYNRLFGRHDSYSYLGIGDDGREEQPSFLAALRAYEVAGRIGFIAEETKQMFGKTSEFTRLLSDDSGVYGSICRSIGTFVSGNWVTDVEPTIEARIAAGFEIVAGLTRRGLSEETACVLKAIMVNHWGRFKADEWKPVSKCVLHGMREQNGMGVPDDEGRTWVLKSDLMPRPSIQDTFQIISDTSASEDYVMARARELENMGIQLVKARAVEKLAKASYQSIISAAVFTSQKAMEMWQEYYEQEAEVVDYHVVEGITDDQVLEEALRWAQSNDESEFTRQVELVNRYREFEGCLQVEGEEITLKELLEEPWSSMYEVVVNMNFEKPRNVWVPPHVETFAREYALSMGTGQPQEYLKEYLTQIYITVVTTYSQRFEHMCEY